MSIDQLLFAVFPYVAIVLAVVVTFGRYLRDRFSYSSLSSQFLEDRKLFWGSVPFHYGILVILAGHLIGFLAPASVLGWNTAPVRLYVLEVTALAFGLLALWGAAALFARRLTDRRIWAITSPMDLVLLVALLGQVGTGVLTALFYRWGSSWYAASAVPYLWSILKLSPETTLVANLPLLPRLHIIGAFVIVALLPFTRLVHLLSFPFSYFWRPYQVVVWNERREVSHG